MPYADAKKLQLSKEAKSALEESRAEFAQKFGRLPTADDPLFWDPDADEPTPMSEAHMRRMMVNSMLDAEVAPHLIFAFATTGLCLTQDTLDAADDETRADWEWACETWNELLKLSRKKRRGRT